jgi:hypothetical protein
MQFYNINIHALTFTFKYPPFLFPPLPDAPSTMWEGWEGGIT